MRMRSTHTSAGSWKMRKFARRGGIDLASLFEVAPNKQGDIRIGGRRRGGTVVMRKLLYRRCADRILNSHGRVIVIVLMLRGSSVEGS